MNNVKKFIGVWALIALAVFAVFIYAVKKDAVESGLNIYQNETLGIRFKYSDRYELQSRELGNGNKGHLSLLLIEKAFKPVQGGEGPPAINIDVYQNPDEFSLPAWVENTSESNFKLSDGELDESNVAGRPAVLYKSDGLYPTENVVLQNRDYIMHLSSGYLAPADQIREDFDQVLKSLELF